MVQIQRYLLSLGIISLIILGVAVIARWDSLFAPLAVITALALAIGMRSVRSLKSYQYTAWILVAIVCGMFYPSAFLQWGNFDLRNKWLILTVVQVVMFGMGTQMSVKDFYGIKTMGKGVLVGVLCQFTIMPIVGYMLTRVFNFEPEIAAGIILIGSCSSGLASNVMVFIAKANLTLSVTLTAVATLLAPIMTPLMMKLLAGTYVEIDFLAMCVQIVKIVIVPIGSALLYELYSQNSKHIRKRIDIFFYLSLSWLLAMLFGFWSFLELNFSETILQIIALINFLLGAVVVGKLYFHLVSFKTEIHDFMPILSMFGIVYFTTVTTAASRDNIMTIGAFILLASMMHNALGYTFGYWISRILGLDKNSCRTVALEVGLQNGGMASGLAGSMGKLATVGLAAAVFSPWMNISGSVLANFWRKRKEVLNKV
ncbi:bile acid:sodium symporter family protein [Aestuariibaculum lutulentum]|uniref:Bile acid:sodium symporter family protein n=1 Tax=Aestuariibaculum lutulentum TaxID=2920935 RepID=A0ABS9RN01_9FLAO|nr:bile acid:sodium symporter family protein [Aestuariibaculum lutulentum]MCH4553497.1 bile acid:sodium symporter family protein [Aestuariibaculum lutulentum]